MMHESKMYTTEGCCLTQLLNHDRPMWFHKKRYKQEQKYSV